MFSMLVLLNVSFGGGMLGWMLFVPVGFLLDPVFDKIGLSLLTARSLRYRPKLLSGFRPRSSGSTGWRSS